MTDQKQESPKNRHDAKHQVDWLVNCVDFCGWDLEDEYDGQDTTYDTDCGGTFMFNEGDRAENDFIYCPYCGKKISS